MNIIIMDHNETTKDNLCSYLGMSKHSCNCCNCNDKEASCGKEAARLINEHSPDVVVMDLEMPDIDGIDLLKIMKIKYPRIKVLILTEQADTKSATDAINFGADGFFRKRLDNKEFAKKIREIEKSVSMKV